MSTVNTRAVIAALLENNPELTHLYRTSPEFKHGVDLLVRLLPTLLRGMAAEARDAEAARASHDELVRRALLAAPATPLREDDDL